jgi:hypothetical protein
MGEKRNAYILLVGEPERKRPLGRPRRRWVYNIKMDLVEEGWGGVDWIGLAVLNLWVPWSFLTTWGHSSGAQIHRVSY